MGVFLGVAGIWIPVTEYKKKMSSHSQKHQETAYKELRKLKEMKAAPSLVSGWDSVTACPPY